MILGTWIESQFLSALGVRRWFSYICRHVNAGLSSFAVLRICARSPSFTGWGIPCPSQISQDGPRARHILSLSEVGVWVPSGHTIWPRRWLLRWMMCSRCPPRTISQIIKRSSGERRDSNRHCDCGWTVVRVLRRDRGRGGGLLPVVCPIRNPN